MLAKENRFSGQKQVKFVLARGQHKASSLLSVNLFRPHGDNQDLKFAIIVSKKVAKKAVIRNKIRRRIYSAIQSQLEVFKPPIHAVFIVKNRDILDLDFAELQQIILLLSHQANEAFEKFGLSKTKPHNKNRPKKQ